jgi:hypothetical protein
MSDHRFHLKIEFSIYGMNFEWNPDLNWNNHTGGVDDRIIEWFADCYAQARTAWDHQNMVEDVIRERAKVEHRERTELARLKAKYEPHTDNQVITGLRRIQETNPILPQKDPPDHTTFRAPDASASTDFERTSAGLGPNWTTAYDREDWGRMGSEGHGVTWRNPTPAGDFTTSGITCRVCGCKVALKVGDMIERGDPRLCEHLGGPTSKHPRGFGMKAGESSPGDIATFTVDKQPEVESYWPKGDLGDDPDGDLESAD